MKILPTMGNHSESEAILNHREELMVSPTGGRPTLRTAHFLNPSASIDGSVLELPPQLSNARKTSACDLEELQKKVFFKGWRRPTKKWKEWVWRLQPKYQSLWKQAGIYEAIMGSTYEIKQHKKLVLGFAERWSPETNTFIFPWSEATITLEDVMVCGGYSVLGDSVSRPLKSKNLVAIEQKLQEARKKAATLNSIVSTHKAWMDYFMGTGHEIEHEAFLSLWLSKFVLTSSCSNGYIVKHVFPVAISLARGTQIALAPVVLSSIYRDLSLLKNRCFGSNDVNCEGFASSNDMNYDGLLDEVLHVYAPLQFVQLWIWERFLALRPIPNPISIGKPRIARWHDLRIDNVGDVGLAIDLAGESFLWRPYGIAVKNWNFPKFYGEEEQWISVGSQLDEQSQAFARFLRASELVGVECIEQYLPHRVAMQFGLDQDIPGGFARCNANHTTAWRNYNRPINDAKLYIPPRLFESDVSTRYSDWCKRSSLVQYDAVNTCIRRQRCSRTCPGISVRNKEYDGLSIPPGLGMKDKVPQNVSEGNKIDSTTTVVVQTSNANDGAVRKMEPEPVIKEEPAEQIDTESSIKDRGESSSLGEVARIELEARIYRLESELAELKARQKGLPTD